MSSRRWLAILVLLVAAPAAAVVNGPVLAPRAAVRLSAVTAGPPPAVRVTAPEGALRSLQLAHPAALAVAGGSDAQALAVARALAPLWGLDEEETSQLEVARTLRLAGGHLEHVELQRRVDGVVVAAPAVRVALTRGGELVAVSGTPAAAPVVARLDRLGPVDALRMAAIKLEQRALAGTPEVVGQRGGADGPLVLRWGRASRQLAAWQRFIPEEDGLHLGWQVLYTSEDGHTMWMAQVDGSSGRLVRREPLTWRAAAPHGLVFDQGSPQPIATPGSPPAAGVKPEVVERADVSFAGDPVASPLGWVGPGLKSLGNNVEAREDHDGDDGRVTPGEAASAPGGDFSYPLQLGAGAPPTTDQVPPVVTNLFYWTNWAHDQLYALGFDEAAGNFQEDNLDRGGVGGDPLHAFAQQGATLSDPTTNNAYMSTPPDGFSPEMGMFIWGPYGGWYTDSSLDADVMVHEYTHGVTARLGSGWYDLQSGAMNEGNSDFMALNLLLPAGIDPAGRYPVATYSSQDFHSGIRTRPYSTDPAVNGLTYGRFGTVTGYPEVHADGEIWVEALWECRARLIARHGDAEGRERMARLLMDALLLAPPDPSMVEARDALLLAEQMRYGGEDQDQLWQAFAARGMGAGAFGGVGSTLAVHEDFALPGKVTPQIFLLAGTLAEGTSARVWVADSSPAAAPVLDVTTDAGDHESLPLAADGQLLSCELVTVRGAAVPGDGVVQAPADAQVTLAYPGAPSQVLGILAVHAVQLGSPGLAVIADEEDLGLHADDDTVSYQLPFDSEFAGFGGKSLTVSTNGLLSAYKLNHDWQNSAEALADAQIVAPLWFDLRTNGDALPDEGVYVATGSDWVRFHWVAETVEVDNANGAAQGAPVDFACTLYADGRIEFEYGPGNTGFTGVLGRQPSPTVGLGYDAVALLVPGYDEASDLGEASSVMLRPPGGLTPDEGRLALWAGDEVELGFTLPDSHPDVEVTAAAADPTVAALAGGTTVTVPAGETHASVQLTGVGAGRTTITLTTSDGEGATLPVEVFRLAPDPVAVGQVLVLGGPFAAGDAAATIQLAVAGGTPRTLAYAGGADGRQAFTLPANVAAGAQRATVRWDGRALPERDLEVVGAATTLTVDALQPISPAPGQRLRVLVAGSAEDMAAVTASFSGGSGTVDLPVRAVLADGSLMVDVPASTSAETGSLLVAVGGAAATVPMTVASMPGLPVTVRPGDGGRVAPGSRVVVAGVGGGGLAVTDNTLAVTAGSGSWTLTPVADDDTSLAYRLPDGLPAGAVSLTPMAVMAGQPASAPAVTVTSGAAAAPGASSLRGGDLASGHLVVTLDSGVPPGVPSDLELRLAAGPRVRLIDAAALSADGRTATFIVPGDLAGGVHELRLRLKSGGSWGDWGDPAGAVLPAELRVAAAAASSGVGSSVWRTDLALLNPAGTAAAATLFYGNASRPVTVPAGGQLSVGDVVGTLFATSGSGWLRVDGPGALVADSRTYNLGASGTFGQLLPGERGSGALYAGQTFELVGLAESADLRTNLGLVNAGDAAATVRVTLRDGTGAVLAQRDQTVAAGKRVQVNQVFAGWAGRHDIAAGRISLRLTAGDDVHAYASVVDNGTGDPTTVPPLAAVGSGPAELWIAAAAATPGVNDTVWRTDLVLANPGPRQAAVEVDLVGGPSAQPLELTLAAGETRRIADVVGAGGFGVSGSGALRITADRPVLATARVYNQAPGGTFGQLLLARRADDGLRAGEVGWLPMLAGGAGFRTNIGLVNPSSAAQTVRVELFDDAGAAAGNVQRKLEAGQRVQVGGVLGPEHGWARVTPLAGGGPVLVYASVVDNATGDPTTVPLVR